jgi:hypothetical protein
MERMQRDTDPEEMMLNIQKEFKGRYDIIKDMIEGR